MPLDLEAFKTTPVYQSRASVAEVLEDLRQMAPQSELGPVQGRNLALAGIGLIFAGVLSFMAFGIMNHLFLVGTRGEVPTLLSLLFVGMGIGGFVMFIAGAAKGANDERWHQPRVDPQMEERRLLLTTLLRRFQVDLMQDAPVDVRLDMAPALETRKRVHLGPQGIWTRQDFTDPWLSLLGRFTDGTQLRLTVVDRVRTRHRVKTSASGRMRSKVKRRGTSLMTVVLRVDPASHPGLADLEARVQGAVRLPPGARLKRVRVAEDRAELRVMMNEDWVARASTAPVIADASRTATMMLLSLYQVLGTTRRQDAV